MLSSKIPQPDRAAFTLIEMLVVVGVILVLAMALYPSILKAKESGRVARCASNLHQLQVATLAWSADHGGWLPHAADHWHGYQTSGGSKAWYHHTGWIRWYGGWTGAPSDGPVMGGSAPTAGNYQWRGANGTTCITNGSLWSYVKATDIYLCPTFGLPANCRVPDAVRSYSMSSNLNDRVMADRAIKPTMEILFADAWSVSNSTSVASFSSTNEVGRWHSGRGQVVYLDGHVDKLF